MAVGGRLLIEKVEKAIVRVQRIFRVVFLASPSVDYCPLHTQSYLCGHCLMCVYLSTAAVGALSVYFYRQVYIVLFNGTFTEFVCKG